MRRAMRSLSGQLILLVVAALVVAQVISLFLFADERSLAIRAALGFEAAGRAANVARLIEEAPLDLQDSILLRRQVVLLISINKRRTGLALGGCHCHIAVASDEILGWAYIVQMITFHHSVLDNTF